MKSDQSDRTLRNLFQALRERDEKNAPTFERLVSKGVRPQPSALHLKLRLGLAGAAVCVALVLIAFFLLGRSSSDEQFSRTLRIAESITAWEAPTDILLEPPDPTLLRGVPVVGETFGDLTINPQ